MKVNTLTLTDKDFPERLVAIPSPPKQLFMLGNVELLSSDHLLAVVGTRKITTYGRQVTQDLVETVASRGVIIVSGLALGVDAVAHQAALSVDGKTIAVMPCGLDAIYPSSHRNLALRILEQDGLLVSEYASGMPALKQNFIARNRIVSGLGDGILITEASSRSGTMHTANFALEQGKTVMAVPGNITSPESEGTNNLIRTGAIPVSSASDIWMALEIEPRDIEHGAFAASAEEAQILDLLKKGVTDSTEMLDSCSLDSKTFNSTLTMLEITGKIRAIGAGHWSIR